MKLSSLAPLLLLVATAGCQDRAFLSAGRDGSQTEMPTVSVGQFAKEQGMSRREAQKFLQKAREEIDQGNLGGPSQ